jgi:undecaprenyl-diphosphatase
MSELQALLLGIIQGLTEFLPVSSSGHLELGHTILGITNENNLLFAVVVHCATVLSTIVVFKNDIWDLLKGLFQFQWNSSTKYVFKLLVSSVPVVFLGLIFKDEIELLFSGQLLLVGIMLLFTAFLLLLTNFSNSGNKKVSFANAIVIGIAQAFAVLPGISRSGATIATGLLMGNKKEEMARFSFLMVLIPIIGAFSYNIINGDFADQSKIEYLPLLIGFISAFVSGLIACRLMIRIVSRGKLIYFAIYCFIIGLIAIFAA